MFGRSLEGALPLSRSTTRRSELVEHDDVGELDLIDEQVGDRAIVLPAEELAAFLQRVRGAVVAEEARRVDDGDHRVQAREPLEADPVLVLEGEGLGDGDGLPTLASTVPAGATRRCATAASRPFSR